MQSHEHNAKCREVFALLSQYLDLELPPETCQQIEAHIAGCDPCVEFTESLRKTVELCRKYEPADLPAPLGEVAKERLMAAYRQMLSSRADSPEK